MTARLLVAMAMIIPALAAFDAASQASASCAVLPGQTAGGFAAAPVVFVGTIVSTTNGDREARVKVESIWRGPDIRTYVRVVGTPEPGAQATSVDRTFVAGKRYVFVPLNSTSPFQDNNCTATQLYSQALAAQAPADARVPQPGGEPATPSPAGPSLMTLLPWLVIGTVVAAVAGVIVGRKRGASKGRRAGLAVAGCVAVVGALWGGTAILRDVVTEAQGKCDYLPCVGPWTWPSLAVLAVLLMAGTVLILWSVFGRRSVLRNAAPESSGTGG